MPAVLSLVVFLSLVWLFYCPLFSWAEKATRKLWTNVFGSSACFANWLCFSIGGILAWKGVDLVSYRYMGGRKKLSLWMIPPSVFPALPQSPLPRSDTVSWQHCNKEGKETHCCWKGKRKAESPTFFENTKASLIMMMMTKMLVRGRWLHAQPHSMRQGSSKDRIPGQPPSSCRWYPW